MNLPYSDGLPNFHLWGVVMTITICRSQAPGLPKKSFFVTVGTSQRPPDITRDEVMTSTPFLASVRRT
jgi:hypothetical protein